MTVPTIHAALSRFSGDPAGVGRALRDYLSRDADGFVRAIVAVENPDVSGRGIRYALTLLRSRDLLVSAVADPAISTLPQSVALTRSLLALDPAFLNQLVEGVFVRPDLLDAPSVLRVLDLVAEYPAQVANWRSVSRLYDHADERIRSKCATLLARFRYSESASAARFEGGDPRIRANIVEALWSSERAKGGKLIELALSDSNNRVAGNACLALYNAGDPRALTELDRMLASPAPEFRVTAAWVMGRTADARFGSCLQRASQSGLPDLSSTCLRSLRELVPIHSGSVSTLRVWLATMPLRLDRHEYWIYPESSDGKFAQALPPIDFFAHRDADPVLDYSVVESRGGLNTAIRVALPSASPGLAAVLAGALGRKPRSDRWAISVYGASVAPAQQLLLPEFLTDPSSISRLLSSGPAGTLSASRSIRSLLRLDRTGTEEHLVVFLGGPDSSGVDLNALSMECAERRIRLHCWTSKESFPIGHGNGLAVPQIQEAAFADAWRRFQDALVARYTLTVPPDRRRLSLQIRDRSNFPTTYSTPLILPSQCDPPLKDVAA